MALPLTSDEHPSPTHASRSELPSLKYEPLENTEIRLLNILPDDGSDGIRCTLMHFQCDPTFKCLKSYRALSYCWGDLTNTVEIIVNNSILLVTTNLHHALEELRKHDYDWLWIDAICINQIDNVEKGHQVHKMRDIYQRAQSTIAWLGKEAGCSVETIKRLNILFTRSPSNIYDEMINDLHLNMSQALQLKPKWSGIEYFMGLPYWQRTWVIQEVALSESVSFLWGPHTLKIETLSGALSSISRHKRDAHGFFEGYWAIRCILSVSIAMSGHPKRSFLDHLTVLELSCQSHASEIRDKIFGILNLASDGFDILPEPNYEESVDSILLNMTRKRLEMRPVETRLPHLVLDIICLDHMDSPKREDLPSWLIDWTRFWDSPQGRLNSSRRRRFLWTSSTSVPKYRACRDEYPSVRFLPNRLTLVCSGYIFSTIESLSPRHFEVESPTGLNVADSVLRQPGNSSRMCAYRTVYMGILTTYLTIFPDSFGQFLTEESRLGRFCSLAAETHIKSTMAFQVFGKSIRDWTRVRSTRAKGRTPELQSIMDYALEQYIAEVRHHFLELHRRLMVTSSGHVGMAHAQSEPSDSIVLLRGASVPIILRPCEGGYRVIGEAYVHGIMNGQFWHAQDKDSMQDFHLR